MELCMALGFSNFSTSFDTDSRNASKAGPDVYNSQNSSIKSSRDSDDAIMAAKFYLDNVIIPVLCIFGIIGNVLNILVLTRRKRQTALEGSMEVAAYIGLIALAVSDMLYCVSALPGAFGPGLQTLFTEKSFWMYINMFGSCFTNIFSHTSTWLTVNVALSRFIAICHPLHARQFVGAKSTKIAVAVIFVVWVLLQLPMFWTYSVIHVDCPMLGISYYILDRGYFVSSVLLKTSFTYIWTIFGYFVPVAVLCFCNAQLIRALKESYKMRQNMRIHNQSKESGSKITPTLVTIVIMFVILVSPAEIIKFYFFTVDPQRFKGFSLAMAVTDCLHTINFSINFVLYCVVNVHFRRTLKELLQCSFRKDKRRRLERRMTFTSSNTTNTRLCSYHLANQNGTQV